jgi:tetratricopeptide (TPR) repeat protein
MFNLSIGEVYLRQGSLDQALDSYERAVEQNPYNVSARNNIAVVYRRRGEHEMALAQYQDIVQKFPDDEWARIGLIACLRVLERTSEKERQIAEAYRLIRF